MTQIKYKEDLDRLNTTKICDKFKTYINDYYYEMLKRFNEQDLSRRGSIFVIDSAEDVKTSKLKDFITKNPPYRTVGLTLYDGDIPIYITHILLFINNGYAVNIFVEEEYVKDIISNYYKSEVS